MTKLALFASLASVCLLTNCTPYQEVDRDEAPGDVAAPAAQDDAASAAGMREEVTAGPAEGGAGEIDSAVAIIFEIRTRDDIDGAVSSMMTLADKDNDGQLSREEYGLIAPALAQADNSATRAADGGPVAMPGAAAYEETTDAPRIGEEEFFAETAGGDNMISRQDLSTALTVRFDAADADGDGELTGEEAPNFAASMQFARP